MKILVVGSTGLVGSKLVRRLRADGHTIVAASPSVGVDTITGDGLQEAMADMQVVLDVTNSPSFEAAAARDFFFHSGRNLIAAGEAAGVAHHVVLSVVGTDRMLDSGYFRAKLLQEDLLRRSGRPYTILRSTQFFEFIKSIAAASLYGPVVRVPRALVQPLALDDAVEALVDIAVRDPLNRTIELAGPRAFLLAEIVGQTLAANNDDRMVIVDPKARYFGAVLAEPTLIPADGARIAPTRFEDWLQGRDAGQTASTLSSVTANGPAGKPAAAPSLSEKRVG